MRDQGENATTPTPEANRSTLSRRGYIGDDLQAPEHPAARTGVSDTVAVDGLCHETAAMDLDTHVANDMD